MKKLSLEVEYEYDFEVYGVVSSCKEHKLAWALNKCFNLRLIKQKDLTYDFLNKGRLIISNYLHVTDYATFRLFRNKSVVMSPLKKPFLLPDIKEYDYIIQVSGESESLEPETLLEKLRRLPLAEYVKQFDPNLLQFKDNLIF